MVVILHIYMNIWKSGLGCQYIFAWLCFPRKQNEHVCSSLSCPSALISLLYKLSCDLHWESQRLLSTVAKVKLQLGNILFPGSRLILLIGDNHLWREAAWSLPVSDLEETLSLQEWHASIYFRTQYCALLWVINKIWDYHLTWVLLGLYWDGERP